MHNDDQRTFVSNLFFAGLVDRFSQVRAGILKDFDGACKHQKSGWPTFDPGVPKEFLDGKLTSERYPLAKYAHAARTARNRLVHANDGHVFMADSGVQLRAQLHEVRRHFPGSVDDLGTIRFTPQLVESAAKCLGQYVDSLASQFQPSWDAMREIAKTPPCGPGCSQPSSRR
jgi:hypothetical protein